MATHLAERIDERTAAERSSYRREYPRRPYESEGEFEARVDEVTQGIVEKDGPHFSVHLDGGEILSSRDLASALDQAPPAKVHRLNMSVGDIYKDIEIDLPLTGKSGTIDIKLPDRADLDAEAGFFRRQLGTQSWLRFFTVGHIVGILLWVAIPTLVGTVVAFRLLGWNLSMQSAVTAAIFMAIVIGVIAYVIASEITMRLVPQVQVAGFGPYQSARRWAEAIVLGIISGLLLAAAFVLGPWLVGLGSTSGETPPPGTSAPPSPP